MQLRKIFLFTLLTTLFILLFSVLLVSCTGNNGKSETVTENVLKPVPQKNNIQDLTFDQQNDSVVIAKAFTRNGDHPEQLLIKLIDDTKSTLDIAIYSLTYDDIVDAIIRAKQRGVVVRVISDKQQAAGQYQSEDINKLISAGIPVMINTHSGLMHLKVTISDNLYYELGSYNYTSAATKTNDEVLEIMKGKNDATYFTNIFEKMWNDTKNYKKLN